MPNGKEPQRWRRAVAFAEPPDGWIDRELEECTFVDERLSKRFRTLLEQLSDGTGESIPMACQDWANTNQRENPELIGLTRRVKTVRKQGKGVYGDAQVSTVCGILMHSSLAVTTEGPPLGLAAIKFWTRKKFVGRHALNKPNPTRVRCPEKNGQCAWYP